MPSLLVLADDYTGAIDTGVKFAQAGMTVRVTVQQEVLPAEETDVLILVLATRHLKPAEAYDRVFCAVRRAREIGVPRIFKKTDSGLRGNIGAELQAVMDAYGTDMIPFLPALPSMNRIMKDGSYYIDGVPVNQSVFGHDPFTPVRSCDVASILHSTSDVQTALYACAQIPPAGERGVAIYNISSAEEMAASVAALEKAQLLRVMGGCAGLAEALAAIMGTGRSPRLPDLKTDNLAVICGSMNRISLEQIDCAAENGFTRITLNANNAAMPDYFEGQDGRACIDRTLGSIRSGRAPAVVSDGSAKEEGKRECISANLGSLAARVMDASPDTVLVLSGGDTLLSAMRAADCTEVRPVREIEPGVVWSKAVIGRTERDIISKSGGFGAKQLLVDLKKRICGQERSTAHE